MNTDINPDEAVAHGAAVQGAILSGQSNSQVTHSTTYTGHYLLTCTVSDN